MDIPGLPWLTDVLYIKGLKVNLLSITQIYDEDFLVQFSKKGCLILNEEGVQVLKGLRTTDNCYGVIPKPSIGGKCYIMVVIDDFSRYSWVEFLREKSKACDKLERLCKRL